LKTESSSWNIGKKKEKKNLKSNTTENISLKNVRAPEVQSLLDIENNLSPSAMLGYCICLSPAWEGD